MSATYSQPILPWSGPQPEDLRFRRILTSVLALFLVVGATIPQLRVAPIERDIPDDLPPRIAHIIAEPVASPPASVVLPQPPQTTAPQITPPQKTRAQAPEEKPRPKTSGGAPPAKPTANLGLLALSDALNTMRRAKPKISDEPLLPSAAESIGRKPLDTTAPLIAGVTEGSGGIGVGTPTHQQILGATGLPIGGLAPGRAPSTIGDRAGVEGPRETPGAERGNVRTEEEIQEVLNRHKRAIYRLYNRHLLTDPGLHGKVVASISIAPSGKVTACEIVYSGLGARSFEQGLVALIRGIDFGAKPGVPLVTTRVPIEFFPT